METFVRDFGSEWLEREKARVLVNPTRALANGILNEHWRNGSGIEDVHAGSIAPPRPLTQCRLTKAQETLLMQETAELFVPTMRALYHVVSKPSEEIWPEQALPYAIAFKPPADWSLDEQTRADRLARCRATVVFHVPLFQTGERCLLCYDARTIQ